MLMKPAMFHCDHTLIQKMKSSWRDETCLCCSRGLDSLSGKSKSPGSVSLPLEGVILSLQDLIFYFRPPEEELEHEEKQTKLRSLRNRQNLFQEEVICMSDCSNLLIFALRSYNKNTFTMQRRTYPVTPLTIHL